MHYPSHRSTRTYYGLLILFILLPAAIFQGGCGKPDPIEARRTSPEYMLCDEDGEQLTVENLDSYLTMLERLSARYKTDKPEQEPVRIAEMTVNARNVLKTEHGIDVKCKPFLSAMLRACPTNAPDNALQYAEIAGMVLTLMTEGQGLEEAAEGVNGVAAAMLNIGSEGR